MGNVNPAVAAGQTWRRKRDGVVVQVDSVHNTGSANNPYLDIRWASAKRRGACFEDYWFRDYEQVDDRGED